VVDLATELSGKASTTHAATHGSAGSDALSLDASQITSGVLSIDRIPAAALERVVTVADQTARFALTVAQVQLGDVVHQMDTGVMYFVVNVDSLGSAAGYREFTAAQAASVPWSGVTSKPTTLSGYGITDAAPLSHVGATGTAHGVATTSVAGFMSSTDKTKLDGVAASANNYVLPVATTSVLGGVRQGTGLTVAVDGITSVNYGTAAGTAAQGNDARLSDAREWTALTVTQVDAEAGTATTRTAWTAQRVRQAIAAWWESVRTALGAINSSAITEANSRVVVQADVGTEPNQVPLNQYLGTAAYMDGPQAGYYIETGFKDLTAYLSGAGVPPASAPTPTNFVVGGVTRREYAFAVGNLLYVQPFHINHDVKPGGRGYLHVHWTTAGTQTNTVRWELQIIRGRGHNQGATSNFVSATAITLEQAASGVAYRHMIVEASEAQVLQFFEPDELLLVTITRVTNGGTNNTDTVFGLQVDLHYESDRHVTRNKSPNFYAG
jgi:hypothetical protein